MYYTFYVCGILRINVVGVWWQCFMECHVIITNKLLCKCVNHQAYKNLLERKYSNTTAVFANCFSHLICAAAIYLWILTQGSSYIKQSLFLPLISHIEAHKSASNECEGGCKMLLRWALPQSNVAFPNSYPNVVISIEWERGLDFVISMFDVAGPASIFISIKLIFDMFGSLEVVLCLLYSFHSS